MPSRNKKKPSKNQEKTRSPRDGKEKKSKKPLFTLFSIVILVLIVVAFVGSPVIGRLSNTGRLVFGMYDDEEIEMYAGSYMARQVDFIAEQLKASQQADENLQWQAYQVWRAAFERTAIHTAIMKLAEDAGVYISDRKIDLELTRTGPYVVDGMFSEERYRAASAAERTSTRELFAEELTSQQFRSDVLLDIQHSSNEIELIKDTLKNERNLKIVEFTFEDFPAEKVEEFAQTNAELFREIKLSRITIKSDETDANTVYNQLIENPVMFEELALTQSKDAFSEKGGEMGWRSYYSLEPDFQFSDDLDTIFSLQKDEISPVIETTFGWAIFRCDEESRNLDMSEEESFDKVSAYIELYEGGLVEDFLIDQAAQFKSSALSSDFETASFDFNKSFIITDYFPLNYSGVFFFKPVQSIGEDKQGFFQKAVYNESFFETAFTIQPEEISEPVIIDDTIAVMQMINERTLSEEDLENSQFFYDYIRQQFEEQELNNFILNSDEFVDNFDAVFYENIMPR